MRMASRDAPSEARGIENVAAVEALRREVADLSAALAEAVRMNTDTDSDGDITWEELTRYIEAAFR
jgi:hypothetical protein